MPALNPTLRNKLENDIIRARSVAEAASKNALERLAVHEPSARPRMSDAQKVLRRTLRTKARQLGDTTPDNTQADLRNLIRECAYEGWHQMLFAKFLLENDLLMHPEGVAVSFEECAELAREEGDADAWATAARYANLMLPGIFRPEDPLLQVRFALEDRRALETIVENIPQPTFTSDDGLGWVYQFWQTQAKNEVNQSGRKIGGADLPAVTQLFTEHYMVQFLLHNILGAWWADRHPDTLLPTDKSYLRTLDDGTPAAGRFTGWPDAVKDLKLLDPCCGSGHFLVAALALLTRMRMLEENLSEREAGDAVLRDNLHGLELDPRCTQLAAFNLALSAWKRGGYRTLPSLNVACSGISVGGREEAWTSLAGDDQEAARSMSRLYAMFKNAPDLGSLIDPTRLGDDDPLYSARFDDVEALLDKALARSRSGDDPAAAVFGEAARGVTNAARLLRGKYHLVITNVPYLARGKQGAVLRDYVELVYPNAKADLATAFVERCRDYCAVKGTYALVTPQNWLFLGSYKKLREDLLKNQSWNTVLRLGPKGFQTPMWDFNVMLFSITNEKPAPSHTMTGLDASAYKTPILKGQGMLKEEIKGLEQTIQLKNPDYRIVLEESKAGILLSSHADGVHGLGTKDAPRWIRNFWELAKKGEDWEFLQNTVSSTAARGGLEQIVLWEKGKGTLSELGRTGWAVLAGGMAWRKPGVAVSLMGTLPSSLYSGEIFDKSVSVVSIGDQNLLPAIWAFCSSPQFNLEVRKIDQALKVTNATLVKVPFDLEYWQKVAVMKGIQTAFPNPTPTARHSGSLTGP